MPRDRLGGTIQADILKEYIAQKEWCFPVDPAMRLLGDMIQWCATETPRWHPVSISGYHIREAGSTAAQELAFTLKDGLTYVQQAVDRGLDVDDFAPRLSFFFNAHIDFFEEIAKYRAARRIWARELRDTFGARNPKSWLMRTHAQTAGRVADRPAAAQQHHPHRDRGARRRAGRHAVAAHQLVGRGARAADRERGPDRAADAADHRPRDRRDEHDRPARRLLLRRGADGRDGGAGLRLLRTRSTSWAGWSRRSSAASRSARSPTPPTRSSRSTTRARGSWSASTTSPRARAASSSCTASTPRSSASRPTACRPCARAATAPPSRPRSAELRETAAGEGNLMPNLLDCARVHATEGEIVESLQQVFGTYTETPVF